MYIKVDQGGSCYRCRFPKSVSSWRKQFKISHWIKKLFRRKGCTSVSSRSYLPWVRCSWIKLRNWGEHSTWHLDFRWLLMYLNEKLLSETVRRIYSIQNQELSQIERTFNIYRHGGNTCKYIHKYLLLPTHSQRSRIKWKITEKIRIIYLPKSWGKSWRSVIK